jgi:hypothetical protein
MCMASRSITVTGSCFVPLGDPPVRTVRPRGTDRGAARWLCRLPGQHHVSARASEVLYGGRAVGPARSMGAYGYSTDGA